MHSITDYIPHFPFSQEVSTHIDSLIQKSITKINEEAQILQGNETSDDALGMNTQLFILVYLYILRKRFVLHVSPILQTGSSGFVCIYHQI